MKVLFLQGYDEIRHTQCSGFVDSGDLQNTQASLLIFLVALS